MKVNKLEARKAAYKAEKADIKKLKQLVKEVASVADSVTELDPTRITTRIKMARKSYLGEALALCQIIASIYNFPLNRGDNNYTSIPAKQADIEALLGDEVIEALIDLSEAKGYNTFLTDEMEVMEAVEPNKSKLELLASILADELDLPTIKVDSDMLNKFNKLEKKAKSNIELELKALEQAIKDTANVNDMF